MRWLFHGTRDRSPLPFQDRGQTYKGAKKHEVGGVWTVCRRDAGIETAIGNHSFRAIGITDYLERGGAINIAKRMAGHSNVKTTELYDRRGDEVLASL